MIRKNFRIRRITGHKIYRAMNTNCTLQEKARAIKIQSLLILADCFASMVETVEAISHFKAELLADIEKALHEVAKKYSPPCNGMKRGRYGKTKIGIVMSIHPWNEARVLVKESTKNKLFGEIEDWHREGPPKRVFC